MNFLCCIAYKIVPCFTGSAVAHFRFKDEQEWGDDGVGDTTGDSQSQFLSLDCQQLADSLDCLPLHAVLGVDKSIFLVSFLLLALLFVMGGHMCL
jgi:hypothetical protein